MSTRPTEDRARILAAVPLFAGLGDEALATVAGRVRVDRHEAGQWIVAHGDDDRDVYVIRDGRVRVMLFGETRELILGDLGPGALFGDMSAIDGRPRSASVIALSPVTALVFAPAVFLDIVHRYPPVCDAVLRVLVGRIRHLDDRVHEFASLTIAERVRTELLRLSVPAPGRVSRRAVVTPDLTHAEIAARIGAHREAVTRELSALTRAGLVEKQDGRLVLTDVLALGAGLPSVPEGAGPDGEGG